jgi:hypothetical protein
VWLHARESCYFLPQHRQHLVAVLRLVSLPCCSAELLRSPHWCAPCPPRTLLLSPVHRGPPYTHTGAIHTAPPAGSCALSPSTTFTAPPQLLQGVRGTAPHKHTVVQV